MCVVSAEGLYLFTMCVFVVCVLEASTCVPCMCVCGLCAGGLYLSTMCVCGLCAGGLYLSTMCLCQRRVLVYNVVCVLVQHLVLIETDESTAQPVCRRLVLEFSDEEKTDAVVEVHKKLVQQLKPHQAEGKDTHTHTGKVTDTRLKVD